MKIVCQAFDKEVDDGDYPCSMCFCGANDGKEAKETAEGCDGCTWPGCSHPECPISGCIDHSDGKCLREDNFEKECKGITGCPYKEKQEVAK